MRWRGLVAVLAVLPMLMALRSFAGVGEPSSQAVATSATAVAPTTLPTQLATPDRIDPWSAFADTPSVVSTPVPPVPSAPASTGPDLTASVASPSLVARITAPVAPLYPGADDPRPHLALRNVTEFGSARVLLVVAEDIDRVAVLLPIRPNGSVAWVARTDVQLTQIHDEIRVDLTTRTLVWMRGADVLLQAAVAVGAPSTPTPVGRFAVTDVIRVGGGAYGPAIVALTGYSEAMEKFNGGDARIALHGTNDPASIGQAVSYGCVRLPNDLVTVLAERVPLGTPVLISDAPAGT